MNFVTWCLSGYKERSNINTPMELAIENEIGRYTLAIDVIDLVPKLQDVVEWRWPF
jgi:xylulose-5-phosphate/fructose-6-phosphate phosphoketolase